MIEASASRRLARWAASLVTIVVGVVASVVGMGAFFVGSPKTPLETVQFLTAVFALLSVLPLGVLAVFRPRLAAYGLGVAWFAIVGSLLTSTSWRELNPWVVLWYGLLPLVLLSLLLYASGFELWRGSSARTEGPPPRASARGIGRIAHKLEASSRAREALWAAALLGLVAGSWEARPGLSLFLRFVRAHDWISALGSAATALALLPLTVLGIWKPRWAGYLLASSFAVALAYPMRGAHGFPDVFAYLFWAGVPALPLALAAGLFLYASAGPQPGRPVDGA